MAKYDVLFSCGHEDVVHLFGKVRERERRIEWYEREGICPRCWREQQEMRKAIGCEAVTMHYREYKEHYPDCKTRAGSYDGDRKTIVVYVPLEDAPRGA